MGPEEKFNFEIWWVLKELRHKQISAPRGSEINFVIEVRPPVGPVNKPTAEAQENALIKLGEWKAIEILNSEVEDVTYGKDAVYTLKILPKFSELYELYKNGLEQEVEAPKLFEMAKEWAHSIKGDDRLNFDIWQLIKGKQIVSRTHPSSELEKAEYSKENLKRISKVLEIILDELELGGVNKLFEATKVPLGRFRKEGFEIDDISRILYSIDKKREAAWVIDVRNSWTNDSFIDDSLALNFIKKYGFKITKEESNNMLILGIKNLAKLKDIKKGVDKKIKAEPAIKASKFPKLLSGTKWENFIIKFIDDEHVLIKVHKHNLERSFREMGFEDKRNSKPNSQWVLLRLLAKREGEISWQTAEADDKFKKWKERLATQLRDYFGIDYDPFFPYKETKSYKIKVTLIPPEGRKELRFEKEDLGEEISDLFSELQVED